MARVLLFLLAALTAGIGIVIGPPEAPWLYVAAGVLIAAAIGLWVRDWRKARRREERQAARAAAAEEDDLRSLGIMDVRPRQASPDEIAEASPESSPSQASDEALPDDAEKVEGGRRAAPPGREQGAAVPDPDAPEAQAAAPADGAASSPGEMDPSEPESGETGAEDFAPEPPAASSSSESARGPSRRDRAALEALTRTLRLALGARAACLLTQEELALEYRIDAVDAADEAPPLHEAGHTFSTETALLTAGAAGQAVTHRTVGAAEGVPPRALGYHREPEAAGTEAVALVPLALADDPATRFLLIDGPPDGLERRAPLLKHFTRLFSELLVPAPARAVSSPPASQNGQSSSPASGTGAPRAGADESTRAQNASETGAAPADPRPRGEIVAEEMQHARDEERPLALALVYLNRAEAVAERGADEVQAAERALRARLRQATSGRGRVERFGELTYGVFLSDERAEAERWAVTLEEEMAGASDPLEGGVSVGLALMRGPDQSPKALRENATNALREAYTTGTCTVLE